MQQSGHCEWYHTLDEVCHFSNFVPMRNNANYCICTHGYHDETEECSVAQIIGSVIGKTIYWLHFCISVSDQYHDRNAWICILLNNSVYYYC